MNHLAVIIDGNRRWAKANGLPAFEGHRRGYENVKTIARAAFKRGLSHFTVFAFSTENWKRAADEVAHLMALLMTAFTTDLPFFAKEHIRLRIIGRREGLSEELIRTIDAAERETAGNAGGQLNICFNYGGRAEITDAVRALVAEGIRPADVTEEKIASKLWTEGIPDPDLILRTSGERRLSNFLTWEGTYSELLFVEKHWPEFSEADLDAAIADFASRARRYGV
jgi:undecaprenyl diphosphate synthase